MLKYLFSEFLALYIDADESILLFVQSILCSLGQGDIHTKTKVHVWVFATRRSHYIQVQQAQ
jgi:hypothetical protein